MNSKPNWPRIWELFEQALDQPVNQRSPWLEQQCGGDADLLREVGALLAAHETDQGILERSVQPLAAEALNEPGEIASGQQFGPYRILAELGRGGMGVVYKAEDTRLDRTVALKFLAPHLVADPEIRARFTREAKAAATLNHPNICTVYEIEEIEGRTFIAMAYIDGQGLDEKIKQGPLKLAEALDIAVTGRRRPRRSPLPGHRAPRRQARQHHAQGQGARRRSAGRHHGLRPRPPGAPLDNHPRRHARRHG